MPVVSVDVVVTDNDGNYLTGLKKENFRLTEDGTVQTITNFGPSEAPITIVVLLEFSKLGYQIFTANARNWTAAFLRNLKPDDWIALETFNMRTNVDVDFTHNREEIMQGLYQLVFPPFSESNLFDAVGDVLDRIKDVKGKKSVLVLASGIDTFQQNESLDQVMKRSFAKPTRRFTQLAWGEQLALAANMGPVANLQLSSGRKPDEDIRRDDGRKEGPGSRALTAEIPSIMQDMTKVLRNQYSMVYSPLQHGCGR